MRNEKYRIMQEKGEKKKVGGVDLKKYMRVRLTHALVFIWQKQQAQEKRVWPLFDMW